jgi:3-hydroxyisobutyrate dehydrogenase
LCERAGVDADALLNVVNTASGRSFMSEVVLTKLLEGDRKDAGFGFSAKLMRKDVRLALEMATATETEMPLSQLSGRVWAESHDHVTDDQDFSALAGAILAKGKLI